MPPNWDESAWDSSSWDSPSVPPFHPPPVKKSKINRRTMASNPTPDDPAVLLAVAEDIADGLHNLEVTLGIKQYTEAAVRASITAFKNARLALGTANALVDSKVALLQTADAAGETVIKNCRLRFVKLFGGQFNSSWEAAGFPNQSTMVPDNQDDRFTLLGGIATYLTANPSAESADMEATAAIVGAAHTAVSDARDALHTAETAQTTAKKNRDTMEKGLRKTVRGFINELDGRIAEDDERWESFGLNIPANPTAPEAITSLTATATGGGKIHLEWTYATRMTGTRIMMKLIPQDDDFSSKGTADGLEKTLTGFTAGQQLQCKVIPYNDGGDGGESPTVSVTVT